MMIRFPVMLTVLLYGTLRDTAVQSVHNTTIWKERHSEDIVSRSCNMCLHIPHLRPDLFRE